MLNREKGAPPLYAQLEGIFRKQIEDGTYEKGELLPPEKTLMELYEVSRITVRQAMSALAQQGYIRGSRGIGTEVVYEKIDEHMKGVISITDEMKQQNIAMQTTYCQIEKIKPEEKVASALKLSKSENCYRLTRVRCVAETPLVYTVTYLKDVANLSMDSSCYMESLYKYLKEAHGIWPERGEDILEATMPTLEIQQFLEIDAKMPVFKRTRQTFLPDSQVLEYSLCYYPGNRYQYTVDL